MGGAALCFDSPWRATSTGAGPHSQQDLFIDTTLGPSHDGYVGNFMRSHIGRTPCRGIVSRSWWSSLHHRSGENLARSLYLVPDCPNYPNRSSSVGRGVQRRQACRSAFALDYFSSVLWAGWFVLRHLRFAPCRRAGLARFCSAPIAEALRCPDSQHPHRAPLEHMAPVVRDHSRGFYECDWNRRSGYIFAAHRNRSYLCLDVQQHKRKFASRDACTSRTQPRSQFNTDTA